MQCIIGAGVERQLREATPSVLLAANPFARDMGVEDLGDEPTYHEYVERLEKARLKAGDGRGLRWGILQVCDVAEARGLMELRDVWNVVQARYAALRLDGSDHKWADMIAHQRPPGALTDREFLEGHCNGNQFEGQEWVGDQYRRVADAAGVDTTGAVYMHGLASFAGDPKAWVRGRGDVLRVCAERGYNADGAVTVRHGSREGAGDAEVAVADDIVRQRVRAKLDRDPSLALRDQGEVFHDAKQEIAPHWTKAAA